MEFWQKNPSVHREINGTRGEIHPPKLAKIPGGGGSRVAAGGGVPGGGGGGVPGGGKGGGGGIACGRVAIFVTRLELGTS